MLATFADDTAVLTTCKDHVEAAKKLQISINKIKDWTKRWKIKLNETKSTHINFTNKRNQYIPVRINNTQISVANTVKYLGFTLDARLR